MLTIGQLASYAGVTVRAVRHYHQVRLLPEPERDHSGYRIYGADDVIRLIKIRILADAGVPLSRVPELLEAEPDEFAQAVQQIDKRLRADIRRIQRHRQDIAKLAAGDSLALDDDVVDYLQMLRDLGVPETMIEVERDAWIIISAQWPEMLPAAMVDKRRQFEDPRMVKLYTLMEEPQNWTPDDPRLEVAADLLVDMMEEWGDQGQPDELTDPALTSVLDSLADRFGPLTTRLQELLNERGWTGWTDIKQTDQT